MCRDRACSYGWWSKHPRICGSITNQEFKALWSVFVILAPFLGVFIYLIANGDSMARRDVAQAQAAEANFQSYVRDVAGSGGGTADELAKLADLKSSGVISDAEFAQQKAKLLA